MGTARKTWRTSADVIGASARVEHEGVGIRSGNGNGERPRCLRSIEVRNGKGCGRGNRTNRYGVGKGIGRGIEKKGRAVHASGRYLDWSGDARDRKRGAAGAYVRWLRLYCDDAHVTRCQRGRTTGVGEVCQIGTRKRDRDGLRSCSPGVGQGEVACGCRTYHYLAKIQAGRGDGESSTRGSGTSCTSGSATCGGPTRGGGAAHANSAATCRGSTRRDLAGIRRRPTGTAAAGSPAAAATGASQASVWCGCTLAAVAGRRAFRAVGPDALSRARLRIQVVAAFPTLCARLAVKGIRAQEAKATALSRFIT